jgi:hypothetical protein
VDDPLEDARRRHEQGDPFAAWQAYTLARQRGTEIPAWVQTRVDELAGALAEIGSAPHDRPELRALAARAFVPPRRGRRPSTIKEGRDRQVTIRVLELIVLHRRTLKEARYATAKECCVGLRIVERALYAVMGPMPRGFRLPGITG